MKYVLVFFLYPFLLSAQSEFVKDSPFAIKADLGFILNDDLSGIGGSLGISLFSRVDIGFEYLMTSYLPQNDIESSGYVVYAAYNLKSNNHCLKILGGYAYTSFRGEYFNLSIIDISGPLLGILISPTIFESKAISLIPGLNFSMAFLSATLFETYKSSSVEHSISAGLKFSVATHINDSVHIILTPSVPKSLSNSESLAVFGFALGLLFNTLNN